MEKEVILVPKDKCPLDVLAEMGYRTKNSWIFLHRNAYEKLKHSEGVSWREGKSGYYVLTWETTDNYPKTKILVHYGLLSDWKPIHNIEADDIAFRFPADDPKEIFFLKMEE